MPSSQRRQQLVQLLGALNDHAYEPETATGKMLRRSTLRGPAPGKRGICLTCSSVGRMQADKPCPNCKLGQPRGEHNCVRCPTCSGSGRVPYDDYTGAPVATVDNMAGARTDAERADKKRRDRTRVDALLLTLAAGEGPAPDAQTAMIDSWEERDRYSFGDLVRALAELRRAHNLAYRKVVDVYVLQTESEASLGPALRRRLEWGMRYLDGRMPGRLRVPRDVVENERIVAESLRLKGRHVAAAALARRDAELVRLHRVEGLPVPQLQIRFGLSRSQVYEVLRRLIGTVAA